MGGKQKRDADFTETATQKKTLCFAVSLLILECVWKSRSIVNFDDDDGLMIMKKMRTTGRRVYEAEEEEMMM